jgi:hypothetical protein
VLSCIEEGLKTDNLMTEAEQVSEIMVYYPTVMQLIIEKISVQSLLNSSYCALPSSGMTVWYVIGSDLEEHTVSTSRVDSPPVYDVRTTTLTI